MHLPDALASSTDVHSPRIVTRVDDYETTTGLGRGDTVVVPRGVEHKPSSPDGSILMVEPSGTSTTGDRHAEVPDHVDGTTGHELE